MALGAGGDDRDGDSNLIFQEIDIRPGRLGELLVVGLSPDVALPTGQRLVDGLGPCQEGRDGKVAGDLAVDLIAGANLDFVQVAQAVDGSEHHLGGALDHAAVPGGYGVKPAHPAGAACGSAVFAGVTAPAAQLLGLLAE